MSPRTHFCTNSVAANRTNFFILSKSCRTDDFSHFYFVDIFPTEHVPRVKMSLAVRNPWLAKMLVCIPFLFFLLQGLPSLLVLIHVICLCLLYISYQSNYCNHCIQIYYMIINLFCSQECQWSTNIAFVCLSANFTFCLKVNIIKKNSLLQLFFFLRI